MKPTDEGMSLIEVLIAVVVMGLAVTVLITGLLTATSGTGSARDSADSRALLASAAEALEAADYKGCADPTSTDPAVSYAAVLSGMTRPGDGTDTTGVTEPVTILDLDVWNGAAFVERSDTDACNYDKGTGASRIQRLVLAHGGDSLTFLKAGS